MANTYATVRRHPWRSILALAVVLTVAAFALMVGRPASIDAVTSIPGSPYDGTNTIQDTAPNVVTGTDANETKNDNALGQGAKDDIQCPTTVTGSIPPNKSDISAFASGIAPGTTGFASQTYLYVAWTRTNVLGSANFSFEFNRGASLCPDPPTTDPHLVERLPNDLLVLFDFARGANSPDIAISLWKTSANAASAAECESSNALPCWGTANVLPAGIAEGSIRADLLFGEAAINLTAANVPLDPCQPFTHVFVKGRSSASFNAELKDVAPPIETTGAACTILIKKQSAKTGNPAVAGACFTITPNPSVGTGTLVVCDKDATHTGANTAPDSDTRTGFVCVSSVKAGTYSITESTVPANYKLGTITPNNGTNLTTGVITVNSPSTCAARETAGGAAVVTATNIPLSQIQVKFLNPTGETSAQISCAGASGTTVSAQTENGIADASPPTLASRDDTDELFGNLTTTLAPGVYTCVVDIDP